MARSEPTSPGLGARWSAARWWLAILAYALAAVGAAPSLAQIDRPPDLTSLAGSLPLRQALKPVLRDPFASSPALIAPPAPVRPMALLAAEAAVAPPLAVAVPAPPAHELQFIGRVRIGEHTQVLAQAQGRTWVLKSGLELPSGYVVESVGEREVLLRHAALASPTRWPLPAQPAFETR